MGIPPIPVQLRQTDAAIARAVDAALVAYAALIARLRSAYPDFDTWHASSAAQMLTFRDEAIGVLAPLVHVLDGVPSALAYYERKGMFNDESNALPGWTKDADRDATIVLGNALIFQLCLIIAVDAPTRGPGFSLVNTGLPPETLQQQHPAALAWINARRPAPQA